MSRPLQALAWLLLPILAIGATRLGTAPGDLFLVALSTGPAVALAMRCGAGLSSWRNRLAVVAVLAASEAVAQWIGQPHGLDLPQRLVEALCSAILVSFQATWSARQIDRALDALLLDRRPPPLRRLAALGRMVAMGVLPLSIAAGLASALLQRLVLAIGSGDLGARGLDLDTFLLANHALASSLSVLVLVPLLRGDRWPLPGPRFLMGIVLAAPLLAMGVRTWPDLLVVLPACTFIAGWLGGMSGAALATGLSVSLLMSMGRLHAGASPFDGPDGYTLLLATGLRLGVIGMLGMVWNEPRARRRPGREGRDVRSGAPTYRNVMALEWQLARAGYGRGPRADRPVLWLHIDMPVYRPSGSRSALSPLSMADGVLAAENPEPALHMVTVGPIGRLTPAPAAPLAAGVVPPDGLDSTLPSPRLPALMLALARGLRSNDAVVPIAGEALIVLVDDLDRSVVGNLVNRLDVLLLQEGRRHLAPADIRQAALVHATAATVLLTSARYLSIDL